MMRIKNNFLITVTVAGLYLAGCSSKPTQPAPEASATHPEAESAELEAPTHVVVGEVHEADPNGSHLVVKTKDGATHHIEAHSKTGVKSFKEGFEEIAKGSEAVAKATVGSVKKGTSVAVRFTEKEGKKIAHHVHYASDETVKQTDAVIHRVDAEGRKIFVKTKDGVEEAYDVSKDATVTAGNKIAAFGYATGHAITQGAKATIHFTENAGRKMAHVVEHK